MPGRSKWDESEPKPRQTDVAPYIAFKQQTSPYKDDRP